MDAVVLACVIAVLLVVIIGVFFSLRAAKPKRGNTVLLLGSCESGKTALFTRLCHDTFGETYTSIEENEDTLELDSGVKVHVVDFPGHERLRPQLNTFYPTSGAIVFIVDSVSCVSDITVVSQYLYDVFVDKTVNKLELPVLIVCNKVDITTAKAKSVIKRELEKELNQLRTTRNLIGDTNDTEDDELFLGYDGEEFKMEQLPFEVTMLECSAKSGDGMGDLKTFIEEAMQ